MTSYCSEPRLPWDTEQGGLPRQLFSGPVSKDRASSGWSPGLGLWPARKGPRRSRLVGRSHLKGFGPLRYLSCIMSPFLLFHFKESYFLLLSLLAKTESREGRQCGFSQRWCLCYKPYLGGVWIRFPIPPTGPPGFSASEAVACTVGHWGGGGGGQVSRQGWRVKTGDWGAYHW